MSYDKGSAGSKGSTGSRCRSRSCEEHVGCWEDSRKREAGLGLWCNAYCKKPHSHWHWHWHWHWHFPQAREFQILIDRGHPTSRSGGILGMYVRMYLRIHVPQSDVMRWVGWVSGWRVDGCSRLSREDLNTKKANAKHHFSPKVLGPFTKFGNDKSPWVVKTGNSSCLPEHGNREMSPSFKTCEVGCVGECECVCVWARARARARAQNVTRDVFPTCAPCAQQGTHVAGLVVVCDFSIGIFEFALDVPNSGH